MTYLITGGAGYIGSHIATQLAQDNQEVVVYDSLISGLPSRLPSNVMLEVGDVRDEFNVHSVLKKYKVRYILHLAALKSVEESFKKEKEYNSVNVDGTRILLKAAIYNNIERFIFSSSAAVYGVSDSTQVSEKNSIRPISPYGKTKYEAEKLLLNAVAENKISGCSLRYFNVGGRLNPLLSDMNVSNVIPIFLQILREGGTARIFGNDFETRDGTCERDYIHVCDVAMAHCHVLKTKVEDLLPVFNLGTGRGTTVYELINLISELTGVTLKHENCPRRDGDPASIVADPSLIREAIGYQTKLGIRDILSSILSS